MRTMYLALTVFCAIISVNVYSFAGGCPADCSGAGLVEKTGETEIYARPDGTKITKFSDRDETLSLDGTRVTCYHDGRRVVQKPGGETIEFRADGSVSYSGNGQKREVSMKGKTPYGLDIKEESRTIQRAGFVVELIYTSSLSDDLMDNYTRALFDELEKQIERWMYSKTVRPGRIQVLVSNCRFCVTGYCAGRKTPGLEIVAVGPAAGEKKVFFTREDVIDKNRHPELAVKAVEQLF